MLKKNVQVTFLLFCIFSVPNISIAQPPMWRSAKGGVLVATALVVRGIAYNKSIPAVIPAVLCIAAGGIVGAVTGFVSDLLIKRGVSRSVLIGALATGVAYCCVQKNYSHLPSVAYVNTAL
jgi:hypothetical protein